MTDNNVKPSNVACPKQNSKSNHTSFKLSCKGVVDDKNVMEVIVDPSFNDADVTQYSQFWYFFIAVAASWIGMAVIVSVGDAICFDLLGKRHEMFGRQRLWGSVGFGIFSLLAGSLVDLFSGNKVFKNYTVIYYLMAAALLPDTLISGCLEVNKLKSQISLRLFF